MKLLKKREIQQVTPIRKKGDPTPPGQGRCRPTCYRPEYGAAMVKYFTNANSWDLNTDARGNAKAIPSSKLPTFERFAAHLGVTVETLGNWAAKHAEFTEAYATAKALQKSFLMELGAAGVGNYVTSLMLRTNHGMVEPKKDDPVTDLAGQLATLIEKLPS
jgi:hypothetical protein